MDQAVAAKDAVFRSQAAALKAERGFDGQGELNALRQLFEGPAPSLAEKMCEEALSKPQDERFLLV